MSGGDEKKKQLIRIEAEEKEEWEAFYHGISKKISQIRFSKDMDVAELENKSELEKSYIYRIESNKRHAGLVSLVKIARGLGVSVDELLPIETESAEMKEIKRILYSCDSRQLNEIKKYLDIKYKNK